jgi:hypothetical protein
MYSQQMLISTSIFKESYVPSTKKAVVVQWSAHPIRHPKLLSLYLRSYFFSRGSEGRWFESSSRRTWFLLLGSYGVVFLMNHRYTTGTTTNNEESKTQTPTQP